MKKYTPIAILFSVAIMISACSSNPYAPTNKVHKKQLKTLAKGIRQVPATSPGDEIINMAPEWVGTVNFSMRKPNYVIIHHTAQNSTEQTLKTFTLERTQVSSHYVIGRDGKVYRMLNDLLRAWHGGVSKWGNTSDLNSSSIGIELDNNGSEPFADAQINSLIGILAQLKKNHGIPTANFVGHSDIAIGRKVDPNPTFPWKKLAQNGYGLWYDDVLVDSLPPTFNPMDALRIIGYDVKKPEMAIKAFKLHFIQTDLTGILTDQDKKVLYNLYQKYL